ncbi:MAG: G5 domain-containing protein [bacterium]
MKRILLSTLILGLIVATTPSFAADSATKTTKIKQKLFTNAPHFSANYVGVKGEVVPITIATVKGKVKTFTSQITIADALKENNIPFSADDEITPPVTNVVAPDIEITVVKVEIQTVTKTEVIPFTTETQLDTSLNLGEEKLVQSGIDGEAIIDYQITLKDGVEASRKELKRNVTKATVTKIIAQKYPYLGSGDATFYGSSWTVDKFVWYRRKFATSGNKFAAHRTLPLGTKVLVVNDYKGRYYGKSIVVSILDRGPERPDRIIDLSYWAFDAISNPAAGSTPVKIYKVADYQ